ncbi:MAG TPA: tetratricopeptide repeat protein [Vicinamibacteria bacterium]|nr:tetratricopeptide repeat protein [Vicinamibacteria bacterium]
MRWNQSNRRAGVVLGALLSLSEPSGIAALPSPERAGSIQARDLLPVTLPDLTSMEKAVQEQIGDAQAYVASVLENPNATDVELEEAFGETGQIFHSYDLLEAADVCYRNALEVNPNDFRWWHYRGLIHRAWAQTDRAHVFFARVLELNPEHIPSIVYQAELFLEEGRLPEAEEFFQRALGLDPKSAAAWVGLGQVALLGENYPRAVECLETAIRLVPVATRLHYPLGLAYRGLGNTEKARAHMSLRGPVGVKVTDPLADELEKLQRGERVYLIRGRRAFQAGRFAEAAAAFRESVRAEPGSYRARVNLGSALAALGDEKGAQVEFRRALEINPDSAAAHFNLGHLLARDGLYGEAEDHLRLAVQSRPQDFGARMELADILKAQNALDGALEHYRKAVSLNPTSEQAYLGEIEVLIRTGAFAAARERLEAAHQQFPERGPTAHVLARFLAGCPDRQLRDGTRALDLAARVFEARPSRIHAETVAMAFAELGRCEDASQWQRTAIAIAEKQGEDDILPQLAERLEKYEQGLPCSSSGPR